MTAMSALVGKATAQVKRLMGGKDVVDVAGWAHRVEAKYPKTASFHFQHQTTKWDCVEALATDLNCPENRCLTRALQHFYGRLTGRPNLVKLEYPDGLQLTDSDAVKFLVNLLGDLHQPLHVGFAEDFGGHNITLIYTDAQREKKQTTMFNYWDSALVQKSIQERPAFWYGGWTHSHSLGDRLTALRREWDSHESATRHLLFAKWATESLHLVCNSVYKESRSGAIIPNGFEIGSTYEFEALEVTKRQILTAGARIGFVLNTILSERDASKLRQGSGVEVPSELLNTKRFLIKMVLSS
ncbi:uncharacterized protein LOC129617508 [Condylostylus longicornis]|uniref:uncharacterized protein LOC129617508 n=1 Tax=Condylostylus longicornis TaxID=2530218 RepID=UPI00244DA76A|nr:uncharacterized protein LOC129617508 [Condylostylus longicornis]